MGNVVIDNHVAPAGEQKVSPVIQQLKLSQIVICPGTQARAAEHETAVSDYAEAMKDGAVFPPVVVFDNGEGAEQGDDPLYFLGDGFHRVAACTRNGTETISAEIRQGGRLEALKYSIEMLRDGIKNGLRTTSYDKRHAVKMALLNFTEASQTEIAALCGVTQQYVSKIAGTLQRVVTSTETRKDSRGRPQPKRKPRRKKLTPQEQKQLDECEATIAKHVTSSWGMHYAEMAILDLELISPTDSEREQAFAHVEQWIAGARQQQAA